MKTAKLMSAVAARLLSRREVLAMLPLAAAGSLAGCAPEDVYYEAPAVTVTISDPPVSPAAGSAPALNAEQIGFGIHHYLVTGQSLATGEQGFMGISNTQPFANVMLGPNPNYQNFTLTTLGAPAVVLTPLISGPQVRETIGNGFCDLLTSGAQTVLAKAASGPTSYRSLISCSGVPGAVYQQLCGPSDWNAANPYWAAAGGGTQGSTPFQEMMSQVAWGMKLASQLGVTYRVAGMIVLHGEFDSRNPQYAGNLQTWQSDMQNGVQALTGQSEIIPMIAAQTQCIYGNGYFAVGGGAGLYNAAMADRSRVILACPEYAVMHHLAEETGPDAGIPIHPTADGYRHLGQMMSKAARVVTMEAATWFPLMPVSWTRDGNQIVIRHYVPALPLVFDTSWVTDPGHLGYSYVDAHDSSVAIVNVAITAADTVTLTLNKKASGGTLGYANLAPPSDPSYNPTGGGSSTDYGPTRGPRGCLRDSDPAVAYYSPSVAYYQPAGAVNHYPMQNYCVAWQISI